jgi:nicotinate dehydrogenase subunit B
MSADPQTLGRRQFLQGSGLLLVAAGGATLLRLSSADAQQAGTVAAAVRGIAPEQLDTWITIDTAGLVTAFFGKMDMGQGVDTVIAQIVADELDVGVERVSVVMGDTHRTPNQGGASGSSACRQGANALRNAAAEARRVLLDRAGVALGVAPALLRVSDGRVSEGANASRSTTYGELIADGFRAPLQWNRQFGNGLTVRGAAPVKAVADYQVVGKPVARKDIAGKVLATTEYCVHVNLPGMLHARVVRPPVAGSVPAQVDEGSIAAIAGAQVVQDGDFLAVVAPDEWAAIRASRELKVRWSEVPPPFPADSELFDYIRKAPVVADNAVANFGARQAYDPAPVLAAIAAAPRRVEAEYEVAFQSHARMAPSIGVADVGDDSATIYADVQKPHDTRTGIAKLLGLPPEKVRVIWKPGAGSYGRSDADEAAFEAALLSQRLRKPVRVQWMRHEGHGWDPKAPAAVLNCKAGINAEGGIAGWYFRARGFSGWDVYFNAADPRDTLVGQLTDWPKGDQHNFGVPGESYEFPNSVKFWETIPGFLDRASPLRTAHMRAPQELQLHFAHESFIDEVAVAMGTDPVALRLKYLKDPRERAVIEAVAKASAWQPRGASKVAGRRGRKPAGVLTGRGISLNSGFGGYVATVAEVEVDPRSGRIWARRFWVANDCGIVLNPRSLRTTIEGNIVQGISRSLFEQVRFDARNVTSVDWAGYPILEMPDAPESIEIVMVNRPDQPAGGAGEPAHVTVPAALANAFFDATGVRLRRMPMTAENVRQALRGA